LAVFMNTPFGYGSVSRILGDSDVRNDRVGHRERNWAAEAALFIVF
jgi:hypothetical protein